MSKTTNKMQLQQLFSLMEANPAIACGFYKGGKEELVRFWKKAEADLNSMGPPNKCITEWKKVWADQKKYVRQKAAQHLKYKNGTGGGPNKDLNLSSLEQGIYNLVGMKTAVEGVAANVFGLETLPDIYDDGGPCAAEVADELQAEEVEQSLACADVAQKSATVTSSKPSKALKSASDALQAELDTQKELLGSVKEAVKNSQQQLQHSKKIARCSEKSYELQKSHFKRMEMLKREEIDEMRRHNAFMEKMRAKELEYKLEKNNIQLHLLQQQ